MKRPSGLARPFLIVNPKSHLCGDEALALARHADALSGQYGIDVLYTAQYTDLARVAAECPHLTVCAQHMDPLEPGSGVGRVIPEALAAAGARATFLNHASHPMGVHDLTVAVRRAREVGLLSVVLADSVEEGGMLAHLEPDVMICEQTSLIGTGRVAGEDYMRTSTEAVKRVSPRTLIIQAAGIHSGQNVYDAIMCGADGSGGTSGILNAPDPFGMIEEMIEALARARAELEKEDAA